MDTPFLGLPWKRIRKRDGSRFLRRKQLGINASHDFELPMRMGFGSV